MPERIARRRDASGEHWQSAGGRGYRLDPASPLATSEWLVIADAVGEAKGARITSALALAAGDVQRHLAHRIAERVAVRWNAEAERAEPVRERRLGAVTVSRGTEPGRGSPVVREALLAHFAKAGLAALPLAEASLALLTRADYAGLAALSAEALAADAAGWLAPLLAEVSSLRDIRPQALHDALAARLDWDEGQRLEALAPAAFVSPAGTRHGIDYADPAGPSVEVRVQALFGLDRHPTYGRPPRPLLLKLTSPAGRPLQSTADLPAFWRGSWRDVVKEMKGRYPRHRWPDAPWEEDPSLKTKNAFAKITAERTRRS